MIIEKKDFKFELKAPITDDGSFTGYASVFGIEDDGSDIVVKGAFTKTIAEMKSQNRVLPMLWAHRSDKPIGTFSELKEDDYGLYCEGQFVSGLALAQETRALMQAKAVNGLSIGFRAIDYEIDNNANVRKLKEVKLYEISAVTFPMLDIARVTDVKSADFDPRELERLLKGADFTNGEAMKAVAIVKKYLQRDAGGETELLRDAGMAELLETLRETRQTFR